MDNPDDFDLFADGFPAPGDGLADILLPPPSPGLLQAVWNGAPVDMAQWEENALLDVEALVSASDDPLIQELLADLIANPAAQDPSTSGAVQPVAWNRESMGRCTGFVAVHKRGSRYNLCVRNTALKVIRDTFSLNNVGIAKNLAPTVLSGKSAEQLQELFSISAADMRAAEAKCLSQHKNATQHTIIGTAIDTMCQTPAGFRRVMEIASVKDLTKLFKTVA